MDPAARKLHPALHPVVTEALGSLKIHGLVKCSEDERCCPTVLGQDRLRWTGGNPDTLTVTGS
ncbi:MAG: hypothetical protein ACI8S6_005025 [Myxococcota bacterium]|jgi:hypothetical protein